MIPQAHLNIYKIEWKHRGFSKNRLCWFKRLDELTQVFKIENRKGTDCYVAYIGVALNRKLKRKCPTKYDKAWIINFRVSPLIISQNQKSAMIKEQGQCNVLSPYHHEPLITIKTANDYFDQLRTIGQVIDFINTSNQFSNIESDGFIKRIFDD